MSKFTKVWLFLSGSFVVLFLFGWLLCGLGFRVNFTVSIPPGLYYTQPVSKPIQRGQIAFLCPPDTPDFRRLREKHYIYGGNCPGNYLHWLKPVVALPGDKVMVNEAGVWVNGRLLANTRPLAKSPNGLILPRLRGMYTVHADMVWVVSGYNRLSLDSRYLGAIPIIQIERTATPILLVQR